MSEQDKTTRRDVLSTGGALGGGLIAASRLWVRDAHAAAADQVPRRVLGKTKEKIPILLMGGSMVFDPKFDPKLAEAVRYGVNYFDAADCYGGGTCEAAVGAYHTRAKNRAKVWITSKSDDHDPVGFDKKVANSLKELRTETIDMYFLHMLREPGMLNKDLEKVVARLKKEGKIRHFGFSCHHGNVAELLQLAAKTSWVDAVMFRYNFRQYGNKELNLAIDAAAKANVGLIAMKTQGSAVSFEEKWKPLVGKWSQHQAVLKAVWADDRITAAVSHMDTFEKLKENVAAALDKRTLGAADWQQLQHHADATRSQVCDGCDHICGAHARPGLEIGSTLRYLMYHDVYGTPAEARARFAALPEAARQIAGVDFQAAAAACPNGVDLVRHMQRAVNVLT